MSLWRRRVDKSGTCSTIGTWMDAAGLPMPCYLRDSADPSSGIKCHLYADDSSSSSSTSTHDGSSIVLEFAAYRLISADRHTDWRVDVSCVDGRT